MPVEYRIDPVQRIVYVTPRGTLTAPELLAYQKEVWSRPDVAGFSELVDMREVGKIDYESPERVREVAGFAATMDPPQGGTKLAMVATHDAHFGLARMYQSFREANPRSTREVRTFRSMEQAMAWLLPTGAASSDRPSA
jgi:hypothetical protein